MRARVPKTLQLKDASRSAKASHSELTCKDETTGFCNAVLAQGLEPHGIANKTKQDGHHDETP